MEPISKVKTKTEIKVSRDIEKQLNGKFDVIFALLKPGDKNKLSLKWGNGLRKAGQASAASTAAQENCTKLFFECYFEHNRWPTNEEILKVYPECDEEWLAVFKKQAEVFKDEFLKNEKGYTYSRDKGIMPFIMKGIKAFFSGAKDSWNPGDIYMIKKAKEAEITRELKEIFENKVVEKNQGLMMVNDYMRARFRSKELMAISLKKLKVTRTNKIPVAHGHTEISNLDKKVDRIYPELNNFAIHLDYNIETDVWKNKGSTFAYGVNGVDITAILKSNTTPGTKPVPALLELAAKGAAAKLGRVPADITNTLFDQFRLTKYGTRNLPKIGELDAKEQKMWLNEFDVVNSTLIGVMNFGNVKSSKDFEQLLINISILETSKPVAGVILRLKLQGIHYAYLLALAKKKGLLDDVLTDFYYGAKKETKLAGVFIKIA